MKTVDAEFEDFVATEGSRLRVVLAVRFGPVHGADAFAAALEYAWYNWERVSRLERPVGYLTRVGATSLRPQWRSPVRHQVNLLEEASSVDSHLVELADVFARLSAAQRVCVLLVKGFSWSYREASHATGYSEAAVTNHVHRGLKKLRKELGHE